MLTQRERRALHGALRPAADGALDARRRRARDLHRGRRGPRLAARRRLPRRLAPAGRRRCARSCRACTHQFLELAGVDITKAPMEVGPTCHYIMGGIRGRRRDRRRAASSASSRRASARAASRARRGSAGTRSPTCSCSAAAPARPRPSTRARAAARRDRRRRGRGRRGRARRASSRPTTTRTRCTPSCSRRCSANVGIYRDEAGLTAAVDGDRGAEGARPRTSRAGDRRERRFNPGWHLWMDLRNMLVCAEAIARAALRRHESRGAHSRLDFPEPSRRVGPPQHRRPQGRRRDGARRRSRSSTVDELEPLVAERRAQERRVTHARVRAVARRRERRRVRRATRPRRGEGTVVLDAVHEIQRTSRARPRRALELQGGEVRLVRRRGERQAAPDVQDAPRRPARRPPRSASRPLRAFPVIRDLVTDVSWNYEVNKRIPPFAPKPDADWRMQQEDVERIEEFRKCIECFLCQNVCHVLRDHQLKQPLLRPALPRPHRRARDAPARHRRPHRPREGRRRASRSATSRSAAPRSARRGSRSPTTRSSR